MGIEHFSHNHPLFPCEEEEGKPVWCPICAKPILGPAYFCLESECHFFIHKSCAELPAEIEHHPFHPPHRPFILVARAYSDPECLSCGACNRAINGFFYRCSNCPFLLDLFCASLTPTTTVAAAAAAEESSHHPTHPHPLTLCDNKIRGFDQSCSGCRLQLEDLVYVCLECNLLLDKSCAELPLKIFDHPFHRPHPLSLFLPPATSGRPNCWACGACCEGFTYHCSKCNHYLDIDCVNSQVPFVKSENHKHPLAFITTSHTDFSCNECRYPLKKPFFRCMDCGYNLHANCNETLPQKVKHRCHLHPLTLKDSPAEDCPGENEDDPTIEYYCDACEELRGLFERTYYCAESGCNFVAHVDCVASKVVPILAEEWSSSPQHNEKVMEKVMRKVMRKVAISGKDLLLVFMIVMALSIGYKSRGRCLVRL